MCDALRNGNVALLLKILAYIKDLTLCNEVNILKTSLLGSIKIQTKTERYIQALGQILLRNGFLILEQIKCI